MSSRYSPLRRHQDGVYTGGYGAEKGTDSIWQSVAFDSFKNPSTYISLSSKELADYSISQIRLETEKGCSQILCTAILRTARDVARCDTSSSMVDQSRIEKKTKKKKERKKRKA